LANQGHFVKKILSSQLRINMVSGTITTVINAVVMIVAYPIYLHFLGYEKYGLWLVLATVLTFAQLGNLGMGQAITKLVAEEYARNNIKSLQQYVTAAMTLLCVSGTVVLIVILVLKNQIVAVFKLSNENTKIVLWLFPYIGVLSVYVFIVQLFEAVLCGLGRMDLTNYIQSLSRIVNVIVASVLLFVGFGIKSLIIAGIVSYVLIHIANLVCIWRIAPIRFLQLKSLKVYRCKKLLHFGGAVFGGSLIGMLLSPFNKLMLSRYAGVSTVPIYEIAYTGSMQVRGVVEASLRALMPEISRIGANISVQAKNKIVHLNKHAIRLVLMLGIPIYCVLAIFTPLLFKIWLRGEFTETLPQAFRIMLIGTFLSLLCVPAYYTLMGLGKVYHCFLSQVIQGIVNALIVGFVILFVENLSMNSVAIAVMTAMAVTSFYVIIQNLRTMQRLLLYSTNQNSAINIQLTTMP
jgi:O-antigen/teichoic acid export membrane protein